MIGLLLNFHVMDRDKLRRDIENNIPDYIKAMNDEIQNAYVEHTLARCIWDESEWVAWHFENKEGKDQVVNLGSPTFAEEIKQKGGSDYMVDKAKKIRKTNVDPLIKKISHTKMKYRSLMAERYSSDISEHTEELVELFAQYYTVKDIIEIMKHRIGRTINNTSLKLFFQDNKLVIEKKRQEFQAQKKEIFIATETGRLKILNDLLLKWNIKFQKDEKLAYSSEIRKILEQARKEIKGDQLYLTMDGQIDINATVHGQENISHTLRKLNINMLIIGLVAAKTGQNPAVLMGQLASSYYKNENGFNGGELDGKNIQLPGDIIRNMGWDELRKKHEELKEQRNEISDALIIEETKEKATEGKRKELLRLLHEKKMEREGIK